MGGSHPIEALMKTAMESIQQMVDVNTVVGDPVESPDGSVIIPISRVACGFAAGGSEFPTPEENDEGEDKKDKASLPFGGGSGAGVSVKPVGFLVVGHGQVRLIPVDHNVIADRVIDEVPNLMDKLAGFVKKDKDQQDQVTKEDIIIVNE